MWFVLSELALLPDIVERIVFQWPHAVAPTTPVAVKLESSDVASVVTWRRSMLWLKILSLGRSSMGDTTKPAIRNAIVRVTVRAVKAKKTVVIHKYFR